MGIVSQPLRAAEWKWGFLVVSCLVLVQAARSEEPKAVSRLAALTKFADTVLQHGRDTYGEQSTPLFVDGLRVDTLRSPEVFPGSGKPHQRIAMSNFAYQQNLLRILVGLSCLTGEVRYRRAAEDATRYMFDHYQDEKSGLFYWGTHRYLDLREHRILGEKGDLHELKSNYPFYEFLRDVDPEGTERLVKGIWVGHVSDWSKLIFNRHATYGKQFDPQKVWNRPYDDPQGLVKAGGLAFLNAGSDLAKAGMAWFRLTGDRHAYSWADRLVSRYAKNRHPQTKILPMLCNDHGRGRCQMQFPGYPQAIEANILVVRYMVDSSIGRISTSMLYEADCLLQAGHKAEGEKLAEVFCDHIEGYARHAYKQETNELCPILIDGTNLSRFALAKDGYVGRAGKVLENWSADEYYLPAYAIGYRLSKREALWETLRDMMRGNDLGRIAEKPGNAPRLNLATRNDEPRAVFALIELFKATRNTAYLDLADAVAANMMRNRYHEQSGLFTVDRDHLACPVDSTEAYALLLLEAARQGRLDEVPSWTAGGEYEWTHIAMVSGHSPFAGPPYELMRSKPE